MTTNWRSWCWHLGLASVLTISWVSVVTPNVVISAPDDENTADAVPEDTTTSPQSQPTTSPQSQPTTSPQSQPTISPQLPVTPVEVTNIRQNSVASSVKISMSLKCNRTANRTGVDLIYLEIDSKPFWGPHPVRATQEVKFNNIPVNSNARIEFFVQDAIGTKRRLGSSSILANGGRTLVFRRYGAYYTLTY